MILLRHAKRIAHDSGRGMALPGQYADCMWDDIRFNHVLPYREARDSEDEKHVHPLQRGAS